MKRALEPRMYATLKRWNKEAESPEINRICERAIAELEVLQANRMAWEAREKLKDFDLRFDDEE